MAIVFKEKLKTQQFLLFLTFFLIVFIIFIIGWRLTTKKILPGETAVPKPVGTVKINFEVLKSPVLKILQPIEKITPLETGFGRENPFLPYETATSSKSEIGRKTPSQ